MTDLTDTQLELAARFLCQAEGGDPDKIHERSHLEALQRCRQRILERVNEELALEAVRKPHQPKREFYP